MEKIEQQEKQEEKSVQDTQQPPPSPPHATITPKKTIIVKDVIETSCQNINPLIAEDLTKILDQSTQAVRLYTSPILVSVDELLPPPSPPKLVTQELQELSVEAMKHIEKIG